MAELIDSLSGNFTAPHRIYRASCRRRPRRLSLRLPPLTFYICFCVYKGANNGMKLSETKGQHNGREWERDTALHRQFHRPTEQGSEAAERRGLQSIFLVRGSAVGRWVYINFEGRTGGWRKNGAFNGDMKHLLTRRLTTRYVLGLCQTQWPGTLDLELERMPMTKVY